MAEALVIVDFQNDFTPGGALAVPHGDEIAGRIAELSDSGRFDLVVATRDWHPADHGSFTRAGRDLAAALRAGHARGRAARRPRPRPRRRRRRQGPGPATEGYSGFDGTELEQVLRDRGVDRVTLVGLATDYCVRHTALDALRAGFDVRSTAPACGVSTSSRGDVERALDEVRPAGGSVV